MNDEKLTEEGLAEEEMKCLDEQTRQVAHLSRETQLFHRGQCLGRLELIREAEAERRALGEGNIVRLLEKLAESIKGEGPEKVPKGLDPITYANIQQAYDTLKDKRKGMRPTKSAVERESGHARNTVIKHWPYLKD